MEKVQFQLEATLPELKDLHEKGLFTKTEIDQITRRRTAFETSLIRRTTRKDDFFKYAEYEISLERLRRVRWKRLKYHLNPPPSSASSYSLSRRALYILKRVTSKFPGDLAVWLAYVEYASREGMRKVVAKGLTSALQHHPLSSTLYLLLSYHHLHPDAPFPRDVIPTTSPSFASTSSSTTTPPSGFSLEGTSPARTTILLGLRLLPQSTGMWTEYVKLELGWVEALRRRWEVLGINTTEEGGNGQVNPEILTGGEGSFGPDGEDARKAILAGQLVIHALQSSLTAIKPTDDDGMEYRNDLVRMLRTYPSALRNQCLEAVYVDLASVAESSGMAAARAKLAVTTKGLYDRPYVPGQVEDGGMILQGVELVEEIGRVGKEIRKWAKTGGPEWLQVAGEWLGERIQQLEEEDELSEYLHSTLASLTRAKLNPPPSLLLLHVQLFNPFPKNPRHKALVAARDYAARYPTHPGIQRVFLELEMAISKSIPKTRELFRSALGAIYQSNPGSEAEDDLRAIWFAWANSFEEGEATAWIEEDTAREQILALSTRLNSSFPDIHTRLLGYALIRALQRQDPLPALPTVERMTILYRPSEGFYHIAFIILQVYASNPYATLSGLYEIWKAACRLPSSETDAGLTWGEWLLDNGKALQASRIVETLAKQVGGVEVESRWRGLLDRVGERKEQRWSGVKVRELQERLARVGYAGLMSETGRLTVEAEQGEDGSADEDEEMGVQ